MQSGTSLSLINRLLGYTNLTSKDITLALPSKYTEKYEFIKTINNGLQGSISIVQCLDSHEKYAMKTMKYRTMHTLRKHLQKYLIVCQHKFMEYRDVFVDVHNKAVNIIQPLFKETIQERLRRLKRKQFNKSEMRSVISELISKINCMHSQGYVHCDITPSNVMFDENDELHIIDFDLMEKIGSTMTTKGTIGYIAPELFQTKMISDPSIDMWSLGSMICYIAFKGYIPFSNNRLENNDEINGLTEYTKRHSFSEETIYRENKWSFIIDVRCDYFDDYDSNLFQLISDLLSFKPQSRPATSALLSNEQYLWFRQ